MSTFSRANKAALRQGFVADMETCCVVAGENDALKFDPRNINLIFYMTGIWAASLYFGFFLGSTVSGVLVDIYGFLTTSAV